MNKRINKAKNVVEWKEMKENHLWLPLSKFSYSYSGIHYGDEAKKKSDLST